MKIKRRMALAFILTAIALTAEPAADPVRVLATDTTKNQIDKTEKEKDNLENQLDKTEENLGNLEGKRDTLEKEMDYLNAQLSAVAENLEELERQMKEKEENISEAQAALEKARETEEEQRENMTAIVRLMYERREDSYLSTLLASGSLSELLNRADYIEKVVKYDQKMMAYYVECRLLIEREEARLKTELAQLESLRAQAEEEKGKVAGLINQTSASIGKYADQISEAERKAREYEAAIKKAEEDLEYLKKKLAEEIAVSQAAANGSWRDISDVTFEESDRYLLANLIYCEAGGEPYEGQVAVGSVVINRMLSSEFPDTLVGVIYQKRQFSPVASGRLALALEHNKATEKCYRAADEAMAGITNVGNCVFFRTPVEGLTGIRIGGHIFY